MADNQEQLYNEFADLGALEAQKIEVIKIFGEIKKGIQDLSAAGIKIDGAKGLKGLGDGVDKQKKVQDDLNKSQLRYIEGIKAVTALQKQRFATDAKIVTLQTDYGKEIVKNRVEIAKTTAELKAQAKVDLAGTGTLEKVRALREKIRLQIDKTNLADTDRIKQLNDRVNKLTAVEKKFSDSQRQQTLNVGNYQGSAKIIVDALERIRIKSEQATKQFGEFSPEARAARTEFEALERITGQPQFLNISAKVGDASSELKFFTKALIDMERQGQGNSEAANELRANLAKLTDEIADTKQEIKALSSDSRAFDLFAGSVSFAADTFQAAAGAAVLFGASEEDAAQATATLTAVQSVSNGVKGIANELTTKGTAANKAYAFVQGLVARSLDTTASAGTRAKAALGLLGIAVTVIGAVAIAFAAFSKSSSDAATKQKNLNEALKEGGGEYAKAIEQVNSLKNNVELAKKGFVSKTEVVKQYNESMGKVTGQAKDLNQVEQLLNKNADAYIQFTFAKATATAALAKASQLAVEQQLDLLNTDVDGLETAKALSKTFGKQILTSFEEGAKEDKRKRQKSLGKQIDDLLAFARNKQLEAAEAAKKNGFSFFGTDSNKGDKANNDVAERNKKAILDAKKIQLEAAAEIQKQIVSIESFSFTERTNALQKYVALKQQIINEEADYEKKKKGLTAEEINLIEVKRLDDIVKLSNESIGLFTNTAKDAVDVAVEAMTELPPEAQAIFDKINDNLIEAVKLTLGILTEEQKKAIEVIEQLFNDKKQLQELEDVYTDTFQNIANLGGEILGGIFDREKNRIQEQIDDIDRLKAAEIDRINATGDGEEKKAARIKIVEAKALADREALEKKQRALDRQKAIAAKALNVFQMTVDGIQAINKQRLILAEIRAKLLAAGPAGPALFGPSLALASANLFGTIISSATAIAGALAAPIPKFAKGKKATDSYQGLGIVGEAGRELGISKSGDVTLYDKPTLTSLMKGDTILPNKVTEDVLASISLTNLARMNGVKVDGRTEGQGEVIKQLKELNKRSRIIIHNQSGIESSAWFDYHFKH